MWFVRRLLDPNRMPLQGQLSKTCKTKAKNQYYSHGNITRWIVTVLRIYIEPSQVARSVAISQVHTLVILTVTILQDTPKASSCRASCSYQMALLSSYELSSQFAVASRNSA